MAIDTVQRRMAAINPACPWRGPLVSAADTGFTCDNRAAAAYMYCIMAVMLWRKPVRHVSRDRDTPMLTVSREQDTLPLSVPREGD